MATLKILLALLGGLVLVGIAVLFICACVIVGMALGAAGKLWRP